MLRFVFALLLLASTLSCEREPDAADNTLRFINRGDIFTLDLNQMSYLQDFRVTYAIREGLYAPAGPEFTPIPAGALRCDLSEDKRVYTFHLRPDARWSNGDPVTAWDYLFSWRRMLEEPGEYTFFLYAVENAEAYQKAYQADKPISFEAVGAKAIDDHTLRVTLDRPIAYFLDLVAFPALYPRHSESMKPFLRATASGKTYYTNEYTRPPHVVTNGPFKLTKWEFKRVLRMERNPHYWDAANVKLDAIENIVNDNVLSQFLQYEAGAADWISEVPPDLAPELRKANRPDLQSTTAFGTAFLTLYCQPKFHPEVLGGSDNPLSDVRVRQALSMAIDRTIITQGITRMGEVAAEHYIPPGTLPGYTSLPGLRYNVEQ
ncbi:MAG TPA: peptide ABC transporter substrate-binding protein, partial [Tepidisphaeraceae bacterium]